MLHVQDVVASNQNGVRIAALPLFEKCVQILFTQYVKRDQRRTLNKSKKKECGQYFWLLLR